MKLKNLIQIIAKVVMVPAALARLVRAVVYVRPNANAKRDVNLTLKNSFLKICKLCVVDEDCLARYIHA